ncbi:MAG TPA: hypothetical protein PKD90_16075, partial [Phnomibacter sp.]|nr:hypothetical protein [Phnomibacter sp.]
METVKKSWAFCLGLLPVLAMAQNVGVGTTNPEVRLHVAGGNLWVDNPLNNTSVVYLRSGTQNGLLVDAHSTGTATIGRLRPVQGGNTGPGLSIRQNSYVGMGLPGEPQYPLHIHATADQLSTAGIAFTHSALGTDPNTGMKIGLQMLSDATLQYGFLQWPGGMPFYFFQGNFLRMSMEPTGNISIGATLAEARLHVRSDANGASAMIVENRQIGGGVPKALTAIVRDALGVGIETRAENADGSAAPIELTATAIRAAAGNNRNAVSAYATNGVAVRARASSNDGYALHTMGKIKLEGNGGAPQNGRVLTTDGLGNATWQDLPTPIVTRLDNNLNYFSLSPDGIGTLYGSHLLVRTGIAPAPITNPAPSDGDYFFWNANRGALRAGQYFFSQLRHDSIGRYSMALGQRVLAKNDNTIVLGKDARAVANLSHAYG